MTKNYKRIKAQYFIEIFKSKYNTYNQSNCYTIYSLNDIIKNTEKDTFFTTIAIFKIKLK
jgi:hypothetical protein